MKESYEFDEKDLIYKSLTFKKFVKRNYISWIIGVIIVSYLSIWIFKSIFLLKMPLKEITQIKGQYEEIILLQTQNDFTEEKFILKIQSLNLKYPHIIYAQAIIESGTFTSKIFRENNNMFGMKQAKVRINLAQGTQHNHAYFDNWEDCLLDFAFHRATYFHRLRTEQAYYDYLGENYAEDPNYIIKLKRIVEKQNLKDKFK